VKWQADPSRRLNVSRFNASAVPYDDRWWYPSTAEWPPILYHLHIHKSAGTTVCELARQSLCRRTSNFNCNVPIDWWYEGDEQYDYQLGAYVGQSRKKMAEVYQMVVRRGWAFIANEGSLEDEPLFHGGPYLYSIMLREPLDRLVSHFHFAKEWIRQVKGVDVRGYTLSRALLNNARNFSNKVDNYVTRRLCGVSFLRSPEHTPPPRTCNHHAGAIRRRDGTGTSGGIAQTSREGGPPIRAGRAPRACSSKEPHSRDQLTSTRSKDTGAGATRERPLPHGLPTVRAGTAARFAQDRHSPRRSAD
jgi:hypothetical protein